MVSISCLKAEILIYLAMAMSSDTGKRRRRKIKMKHRRDNCYQNPRVVKTHSNTFVVLCSSKFTPGPCHNQHRNRVQLQGHCQEGGQIHANSCWKFHLLQSDPQEFLKLSAKCNSPNFLVGGWGLILDAPVIAL